LELEPALRAAGFGHPDSVLSTGETDWALGLSPTTPPASSCCARRCCTCVVGGRRTTVRLVLTLGGTVDAARLRSAAAAVLARYANLRTAFTVDESALHWPQPRSVTGSAGRFE
jgi:hypothetical protein